MAIDDIDFQNWICPICHEDHLQQNECRISDLKMRIKDLENALYSQPQKTLQSETANELE